MSCMRSFCCMKTMWNIFHENSKRVTFEFVNVILNLSTDTGTITNLFFHLRNFLEKTERETEIRFFLQLFSVSCSGFSKNS